MNTFVLYELPSLSATSDDLLNQIKKNGFQDTYSRFLSQPQISNGFNIFIHKSKDKMSFVDDPKYKNKNFYQVTNPYEHTITNSDKGKLDIASYSKMYFKIDETSKLNIVSRAFYKLWEILLLFDLVPNKTGSLTTAHLAEAPGSFVQALIFFREKYYKSSDYAKDEHYVISIAEEGYGIPTFKKDFRSEYSRVKIYEQDGGDLTNTKSIDKFTKFSKKADLITADGGFIWIDENYQEQEAYKLILGEIITAFKVQEKGGSFVLKLFEIYTDISIKMISILSSVYDKVYITKPLTSRPSNSERYVVCKGFKGVDSAVIKAMEDLLENINKNESNKMFLADILPNYKINQEMKYTTNVSSIILSNVQHESINKMITYINSGNYYGDQYHQYLEEQQKANDFWCSTFYPLDANDMKSVQKNLSEIFSKSVEKSKLDINKYTSLLE
jgi:23S rRNA U2552 (ribose-2'-O)-methylase RlmE/FtsJ